METNIIPDEIEREAKALLEKDEFDKLRSYWNLEMTQFGLQVNNYFEDLLGMLREFPAGTTLRIRIDKKGVRLEFKHPSSDGVPEYKDVLSEVQYKHAVLQGIFPQGKVLARLAELGINTELRFNYLGELITHRCEVTAKVFYDGVCSARVFLDKNKLPDGSIDYELEVESDMLEIAQGVRDKILAEFTIPYRKAPNKIARFREALERMKNK